MSPGGPPTETEGGDGIGFFALDDLIIDSEELPAGANGGGEGAIRVAQSPARGSADGFVGGWREHQQAAQAVANQRNEGAGGAGANRPTEVVRRAAGETGSVEKGKAPPNRPPSWIWSQADGGYWHRRVFNPKTEAYDRIMERPDERRRRQVQEARERLERREIEARERRMRQEEEARGRQDRLLAQDVVRLLNQRQQAEEAARNAPIDTQLPVVLNPGIVLNAGAEGSNTRAAGKRKRTMVEAGQGTGEVDPHFDLQAENPPRKRRNAPREARK
ncbi:hypothetical protein BU16DRAFT_528124 [Lophium mytilinum]|uniref:Uncharacterized protein n=1 Tax=Lophium mytilinum TaxID=390894 RepID=A0A6A6QP76_9PEZI|nr:hypothetical protein BU16DRAFT_528124 [Lophium mytilinum]